MNQQNFLLFFSLIMLNGKLFSQTIKEKDSIIYLKEVVVSKLTKQPKISVKSNGNGNESVGFYENESVVSLIKNIPDSEIASISFDMDLRGFKKGTEFELRLLIFEKDNYGKPGISVIGQNIRFKVRGNKKQKINLDLSYLSIQTERELFIGFETIYLPKGGILVMQMKENKNAISFAKKENGEWIRPARQNLELNYVLNLNQ
jgi:hypothetical protein